MSNSVAQLQQQVVDLQGLTSTLIAQMTEMQIKMDSMAMQAGVVENRALQSTSTIDSGDTAWMLTSTGLVLFMTIPGLMLYYSGMVRSKNVLATVMQIFSITCLITVLWLCFGYSLAFSPANPYANGNGNPVWGDASRFWLQGMRLDSVHQSAPTIPESVYCAYELAFAIITPSLICGAFADRMKYVPMLIYMGLWHLLVYCPVAHSVWHPAGFLAQAGVLDYAGGMVVHISSGMSGLISSIMLGKRKGFGTDIFEPHNILLTAVGSAMLWVGWYGFNAGSAFRAGNSAGYALLVTQISTGTAGLTWMMTEWYVRKMPSVLGMVSGSVCGLVAVTPAAGFIDPTGAFFIGFLAGPCCYFGIQAKHFFGYDDSLDAFGVHAIAGTLGMLLCGFFQTESVTTTGNGVFYAGVNEGGTQLGLQIYGIVVVAAWSSFMSFILLLGIDMVLGLRVTEEDEETGLDKAFYKESMFSKDFVQDALTPKFDEPVQIRFGSSHSRNVVKEVGSTHGAALLTLDGTATAVPLVRQQSPTAGLNSSSLHRQASNNKHIRVPMSIEEGSEVSSEM